MQIVACASRWVRLHVCFHLDGCRPAGCNSVSKLRADMAHLVHVQDMFETWYDQSYALVKQIGELQTLEHAPEMHLWSNAPEAVESSISGGIALTGVCVAYRPWRPSIMLGRRMMLRTSYAILI